MKIKFLKAGNGDSFLLSFKDGEQNRNILIDSGVGSTYYDNATNTYGELKVEIDKIKGKNEVIDLLILSHIDNDHICGLTEWFSRDEDAHKLIKNIWFNSGKTIAEYLKEAENKDLQIGLKVFKNGQTGVTEAIEFENYLVKHKIWDKKIVIQGDVLEGYGVKIQILSPDKAQLIKLLKEYKKVTCDDAYTAPKEKDWGKNISDFIKEENENGFKFLQDNSPKNGSSISFILTINEKCFLFLGDSHPKGIVSYLKQMGYNKEKPLKVELLKISHHGSKSNTNKELIELVKTDNYFISTDSTGHNHPNKRTLARIISLNLDAIFHFNYEHVRNDVFSIQDRQDFQIKARVTKELNFK
jgi:beta-lactamase superfamily II metal-dependent hydrolase